MERFDVSEGGRLAEMVSAAQRNGEVEITDGGEVVALMTPIKPKASRDRKRLSGADFVRELEQLHRELPPEVFTIDWTNSVRQMRDEERF